MKIYFKSQRNTKSDARFNTLARKPSKTEYNTTKNSNKASSNHEVIKINHPNVLANNNNKKTDNCNALALANTKQATEARKDANNRLNINSSGNINVKLFLV